MSTVAKSVGKHLKLMLIYFKYNLLREMENRVSFFSQILFMILNNSFFLVQWMIFFSLKDNIGGYMFNDILTLWAFASSVYGLSHMFFENVYYMSDLITTGKLDVYITQPQNILFNIAISKTNPSAIGDLIYGYILAIIATKFNIYYMLIFTLLTIMGALILTAFSIISGSLTFWIKKGDSVCYSLNYIVIAASTYPEGIFGGFIKVILFTIIPVGFMFYIPVQIMSTFNLALFLSVFLVTVIFVSLAFILFYKGLRRYSSSCLMASRI